MSGAGFSIRDAHLPAPHHCPPPPDLSFHCDSKSMHHLAATPARPDSTPQLLRALIGDDPPVSLQPM
jgi:hypothetical protein